MSEKEKNFGEEVIDAAEQVGKVTLKGAAGILKGGIKATTFIAKGVGKGIATANEKRKQKKQQQKDPTEE